MNRKRKIVLSCVITLVLLASLGLGCGGESSGEGTTIVLGYITDVTGPAGPGLKYLNWGLEDQVKYINEENLIPGVTLKLNTFDTKYDPSRAINGYEFLKGRGAKVIFNVESTSAETLKSRFELDQIPAFAVTCTEAQIDPPGWIFNVHAPQNYCTGVLAKFVEDEDWTGYPTKPKMGFFGWRTAENQSQEQGYREYCQANPDKFEWVDSCFAPQGTMAWAGEVDVLKDCDYIYMSAAGLAPAIFVDEYRARGYDATFLGADGAATFLGLYVDRAGWDAIDGTLSVHHWAWWTYDSPLVDLAKELLERYHPNEAEAAISMGIGYIGGFSQWHLGLEILQAAIEDVGAENFDGTAFYNTAKTYTTQWEGYEEMGFTETKRYTPEYVDIWEWSAAEGDLVRVSDGWLPIISDIT